MGGGAGVRPILNNKYKDKKKLKNIESLVWRWVRVVGKRLIISQLSMSY